MAAAMGFYSVDSFSPDRSVGYLVRRANQMGLALLEPQFAVEGMTLMHWSAMVAIHFARGDTAADLARDLGHDTGAMTRLVDTMEERGWIVRERDQADRRRINLRLTEEGRTVMHRCKSRVVADWNEWLADWSAEEAETLVGLLQKLNATLAAVEARPA